MGGEEREVIGGKDEFFEALPKLIWHEDEPIVWPSSVSLYFVSKLAAQEVKVVLTGEGSDELFAGYGRYRLYLLNQRPGKYYNTLPHPALDWVRSHIACTYLISASPRPPPHDTF